MTRFDFTMSDGWELRPDTLLHASTSYALALTLAIIGTPHGWFHPVTACLTVFAIGVAKEVVWDMLLGFGSPQFTDVLGDAIGCGVALVVMASV